MGEFLDRAAQRRLLMELREEYPHQKLYTLAGDEEGRRVAVNLHYLLEHGLIDGKPSFSGTGDKSSRWPVRLTHKGMDFLQDDGGLTAILGVLTIRLHDDTIRQLIDRGIEADGKATPEQKKTARDTLGKLTGKALGTIVEELTKKGIEHFPDLVPYVTHAGQVALRAAGYG